MKQKYVYVIAKDGTPLMPTQKFGMVRHFLDEGKAKPVQTRPFTIQLTYETTHHTQKVKVGIDAGFTIYLCEQNKDYKR
ncbi:MAG: RRXRR domain-containing protein [Thermoplasmatota archaeon]